MITRRAILTGASAGVAGLALSAVGYGISWDEPPAPATQPVATQPSRPPRTFRRPEQAQIIQNLLRDPQRSALILPQQPEAPAGPPGAATQPATGADGGSLLVEGTSLVERPGRLVWEAGKPMFVFLAEGGGPALQAMELLPNQLLEALEREASAGAAEFVVSGWVTRYKDRNYLLLRKLLRRVSHGNLAP